MVPITADDIYQYIERLIRFPDARICRHAVACDLLSLLEQHGHTLDVDLVKAVVDADDEAALLRLHRRAEDMVLAKAAVDAEDEMALQRLHGRKDG